MKQSLLHSDGVRKVVNYLVETDILRIHDKLVVGGYDAYHIHTSY